MAEYRAAKTSSIITPKPLPICCIFLIPKGLIMSNIRKSTKPSINQKVISRVFSLEMEFGKPKKTRGMEVNSSQMISPGSDFPVISSAWLQRGIPKRIKGMKTKTICRKERCVVKKRIERSNTPAKLPKVPGAGHFCPIGPRVAKKRIAFGHIAYSSRKYFQYFTR